MKRMVIFVSILLEQDEVTWTWIQVFETSKKKIIVSYPVVIYFKKNFYCMRVWPLKICIHKSQTFSVSCETNMTWMSVFRSVLSEKTWMKFSVTLYCNWLVAVVLALQSAQIKSSLHITVVLKDLLHSAP